MQLSNLLRPEKVKNYQETVFKEDVFKYYNNILKIQIYDMGKINGLILPLSEAGIDGYYSAGEDAFKKALEADINVKSIADDVFDQLFTIGWKKADAHSNANQMIINLVK